MKWTMLVFLAAVLIGGNALAQTAPPNDSPVKPGCTTTTTYIHGLQDSFAGGLDPTTPSPLLTAFLAPLANKAAYDYLTPNNHFGDSFQICGCKTCGGKLEIRVRRTNPPDSFLNDGITVGVAPFTGTRVVSALVWTAGDPAVKTLTFNLDPAKLNEILCAQNTNSPWLDVYVQDDTSVDSIKLTILHP